MNVLTSIILFLLMAVNPVTEDRKVSSFDKISVANSIDLYYTQSSSYSVKVEAKEELMPQILTEVKNGELIVKLEPGKVKKFTSPIKVYVTAPTLCSVATANSSDFYADRVTCADMLTISTANSSDVKVGTISAKSCTISTSNSSDCIVKELNAPTCMLKAANSSDISIELKGVESLTVNAANSSDVTLKGTAKHLDLTAANSSDINIKGLTYETITQSAARSSKIVR